MELHCFFAVNIDIKRRRIAILNNFYYLSYFRSFCLKFRDKNKKLITELNQLIYFGIAKREKVKLKITK